MKKTDRTVFTILLTLTALLAAAPAKADRFSFGLGVSDRGSFFTLGVSNGHGCRPAPACPPPRHYHRPPVVCAPRPVFVPEPVVYAPPPVVQTVVVSRGYWVEREENVWIEGCWVETFDAFGRRCKQWQPGRWELRRTREWVNG